ncbi:hypothetical protein VTK56DRAFT_4093 [Thermocarpiscus australiensis]
MLPRPRLPRHPAPPSGSGSGDPDEAADSSATQPTYEPSVADVLVVKAMLNKGLSIPPEIADTIIDLAEYWPHTTTEVSFDGSPVAQGRKEEDVFLLRTPPLGLRIPRRLPNETIPPKPQPPGDEFSPDDFQRLTASSTPMLAHPCRRIAFTIRSRDQGWGGLPADRHTYNGSWTWFEVGLERWCKSSTADTGADTAGQQKQQHEQPSLTLENLCTLLPELEWLPASGEYLFVHPLLPREDLKIQCNATSMSTLQEHRVVWSYNDDIDPERDVEAAARLARQGRGKATGNGKFVRDLKLGDVITVWAKARFPLWVNYVESVKVDVYFAV